MGPSISVVSRWFVVSGHCERSRFVLRCLIIDERAQIMSVLCDLVTSFPASIQSLYCSRKINNRNVTTWHFYCHEMTCQSAIAQTQDKAEVLTCDDVQFFFKNFPLSVSGLCANSVLFLTAWHLLKSPHLNDSLHLSHFIWSRKAPGNSEIIMKAASHWCSS